MSELPKVLKIPKEKDSFNNIKKNITIQLSKINNAIEDSSLTPAQHLELLENNFRTD